MAPATESELRGLFDNYQKVKSMRMDLPEMGHPKLPAPLATGNTAPNSINYGTAKKEYPEQ